MSITTDLKKYTSTDICLRQELYYFKSSINRLETSSFHEFIISKPSRPSIFYLKGRVKGQEKRCDLRKSHKTPNLFIPNWSHQKLFKSLAELPQSISVSIEMQAAIKVESGREIVHPVTSTFFIFPCFLTIPILRS